jgi:hypothetical protein
MFILLFMTYFVVYASLGHQWARKCWSFICMSGHVSASPSFVCVKVDDCCNLFSAGTPTRVKIIEIFVKSGFATDYTYPAIVGYSFYFVRTNRSCIAC